MLCNRAVEDSVEIGIGMMGLWLQWDLQLDLGMGIAELWCYGSMVLCIDGRCSKGRGIMDGGRWKMVRK